MKKILFTAILLAAAVVALSPVFENCGIAPIYEKTVYAADGLDFTSTDELILSGEVKTSDIRDFPKKEYVSKITALEGTKISGTYYNLFRGYKNCKTIDLSNVQYQAPGTTHSMFAGCYELEEIKLGGFDTSRTDDMASMFSFCQKLKSIDLSDFNTRNVTDMSSMFEYCTSLTELDLSSFHTHSLTKISHMFENCYNLKTINLSNFDTSNVEGMQGVFSQCKSLKKLDLKNFETGNVTSMSQMFMNCTSLTSLDLSNFDTSKVKTATDMFYSAKKLSKITLGEKFNNVTEQMSMDNTIKWVNTNALNTTVSGNGEYAVFQNAGKNTYMRYGGIIITEEPPSTVYFDTGSTAKVSIQATGSNMVYSWYFKTPDRTTFLLDEEFEASKWTGSYQFEGLTTNGLTDKYDGTEMYCKVWNRAGQEVESEHFFLKKYNYDVDRNISIRLPKVGQSYGNYMSVANNIVPAELVIDWDRFGISVKDRNGKYVKQESGYYSMEDDYVFKAGYKYEFCFYMYLPEHVSTDAIYRFYSKGLIVNGVENGAADTLDEDERSFTDYWTTPVLETAGDVNNDGIVNETDASLLLKHISGAATLDSNSLARSDANADTKNDMLDVIAILNKTA